MHKTAKINKTSEQDRIRIVRSYIGGKTCTELGREYGMSAKGIEFHIKKAGVFQKNRHRRSSTDKREAIRMYKAHVPLKDIAAHFGVVKYTVGEWMTNWGVKRTGSDRRRFYNRLHISEHEVIRTYRRLGRVSLTAKHFKVSTPTIQAILRRNKVKRWEEKMLERLYRKKRYILRRYKEGVGAVTIAREINIGFSTLYNHMRKWGIKMEYPIAAKIIKILQDNKEEMSRLYHHQKYSLTEIGQQYGISNTRMGCAAKEWGWRLHPTWKNTSIELKTMRILEQEKIAYNHQYRLGQALYDFYLPKHNLLIEVHGDYWHGHPKKYNVTDLNAMQLRNQARDRIKKTIARKANHRLLVLWERDLNNNMAKVLRKIRQAIQIV